MHRFFGVFVIFHKVLTRIYSCVQWCLTFIFFFSMKNSLKVGAGVVLAASLILQSFPAVADDLDGWVKATDDTVVEEVGSAWMVGDSSDTQNADFSTEYTSNGWEYQEQGIGSEAFAPFSKISPGYGSTVYPVGPTTFSWTKYEDPRFYKYVLSIYNASDTRYGHWIYRTEIYGNATTRMDIDMQATVPSSLGYCWQIEAVEDINLHAAVPANQGIPSCFTTSDELYAPFRSSEPTRSPLPTRAPTSVSENENDFSMNTENSDQSGWGNE